MPWRSLRYSGFFMPTLLFLQNISFLLFKYLVLTQNTFSGLADSVTKEDGLPIHQSSTKWKLLSLTGVQKPRTGTGRQYGKEVFSRGVQSILKKNNSFLIEKYIIGQRLINFSVVNLVCLRRGLK